MLAYVLALVVGLSSLALYMAAFFFPEVHRKHDFLWSGLGMFYALVLWVCAGRITGGVLLGQTASVTLLGWLGWQTLALRRQVAPVEQQTAVPTVAEWQAIVSKAWVSLSSAESIAPLAQPIGKQVARLTTWVEALVATTTNPTTPPTAPPSTIGSSKTASSSYVPLTPADFANARQNSIPKTIATDAAPVQGGGKTQSGESLITTIVKQLQGAFQGLTAKPESKPVYVRKQFRKPDVEPTPDVDVAVVDVAAVDIGSDRAAQPTTPISAVVNAIVDVEATDLPTMPTPTASSPALDAEILPDPEAQPDDLNLQS